MALLFHFLSRQKELLLMLYGSQTGSVLVHVAWCGSLPFQQLFPQAEHHTALDFLLQTMNQFKSMGGLNTHRRSLYEVTKMKMFYIFFLILICKLPEGLKYNFTWDSFPGFYGT
jgi:hypothetical protein